MLFFRCLVLSVLVALSGCAATDGNNSSPEVIDNNAKFERLKSQFKSNPESVSYDSMWFAYLNSDQIYDSAAKQDNYLSVLQKLEAEELSCAGVDWTHITEQNFWSIRPHISAQTCYESLGNTEQASFHASVVEFILTGVLSSGDGENYYSAYEVGTWGDASDIIELAGYEVIDNYLDIKHYGQAVYFIYVVNDPETGYQKEIYFENNKLIHKLLGIQYPFAGVDNKLETEVVDVFAKTDSSAKIAKAKLLAQAKKYDDAANMYLSAINQGSALANYRLALLCHSKKQTIIPLSNCNNYLFDAAEMGYMNATVALAFTYKEGIGVERDESIFAELMSSVENKFEPGAAWLKLGSFYTSVFGVKDEAQSTKYIKKAAAQGSEMAEFGSISLDMVNAADATPEQQQVLIERLAALAERGLDKAQVIYANYLMRANERDSEKWNEAKVWYEKAAAQNNPDANFKLGSAFENGWFGEEDLLKAYLRYNEAAQNYHPVAQLQLGFFNENGMVVEVDKGLALSWYFLCSTAKNAICMGNIGLMFEHGRVVEKNIDVASAYYAEACARKYGTACKYLGNLFKSGAGKITKDLEKAKELFKLSCDYGNAEGCNNLGIAYLNGSGVTQDHKEAVKLFKRGCGKGSALSCSNLGYMYENGNGLEKDLAKAKELYKKACEDGSATGCSNYRGLI